MTSTVQLDFLSGLFSPLMRVEQAAFMLDDCGWDKVAELLDEGKLRGINVAGPGAEKRSLRIYLYSVQQLVMRPKWPLVYLPVAQFLPHERPTILRRELARMLTVTEQHVSNLNLSGPRGDHDTRHRIWREAVIEFLTAREVGPIPLNAGDSGRCHNKPDARLAASPDPTRSSLSPS